MTRNRATRTARCLRLPLVFEFKPPEGANKMEILPLVPATINTINAAHARIVREALDTIVDGGSLTRDEADNLIVRTG